MSDEFYYDTGHQLLEDRGVNDIGAPTSWPMDEYVWLDGRPVALVKSTFTSLNPFARVEEGKSCQRNGMAASCGIFFLVSDQLGRVVATFDRNGYLTGASQEEHPFGKSNYRLVTGDSPHPERTSSELGTHTLKTWKYVSDLGAPPTSTARDFRVKFHMLDEYSGTGPNYAKFVEGDDATGTQIGSQHLNGSFVGPVWSAWDSMGSYQRLDVQTVSTGTHCRGKLSPWAPCTCSACNSTCENCSTAGGMPDWYGASLEAVEYRIRDSAATNAVWTPFLFPGQ